MRGLDPTCLEAAERAAGVIGPLSDRIEQERTLPPEAVRALVEARIPKLLVPREHGGAETTVATYVAAVERIARADGSAGWCAMITATSGLMAAFLPREVAHAIYAPDDAITCGVFAPMGKARREGNGYRVSGRWPFGSASQHAHYVMGGTLAEHDAPLPSGAPDVRSVIFDAKDVQILDTWHTTGLRGTGSHDFAVEDVHVPAERTFSLLTSRPRAEGALYRQPFFGALAAGVAGVTLGIARASMDALIELARTKRAPGSAKTLAHRETVQLEVGRAEARLRSARAFLFEAIDEAADEVEREGAPSTRVRALVRLAAAHAARECVEVVDAMHELGGGTAIYARSPLERCFRDVHTASAHVMIGSTITGAAGRVLLGLDVDAVML